VTLPEGSVRRPVTVLVATVAVTVFGYLAATRLPVELLPNLSYPSLTIQTVYPDAAPLSVEQFVTRPIEEAVGVVPGVRDMRSTSRAGLSEITLEFDWDENMDFAAMEVRERLGIVELPREVEGPRVLRFDPAFDPIVRIALSGDRSLDDLWQVADRWIKPRFEAVTGVAAAKIRGGLEPEILVEANEDRLAALALTLDDLAVALRAENVNQPGGTLRDFGAVYLVRTFHEFDDLEQIRRTVVRETGAGRVRVEDVAEVRRGHQDREIIARSAGEEVVELALHREGSANTVAVSRSIAEEVSALREEMPPDLHLTVLTDQARYISDAIGQVWSAAIVGGVLAVIVLFFFLRDARATAVVAVTIPVSVLATFLPMSRFGVTLNIMSLGGLALGIGMLVDNSIVVLEAIDRWRRQGYPRSAAAVAGAGEVAGAVTAATFTTICVFLPILFVQGIAGQLFYDLAVTVCLSLLASLLVSLTLIPSMAAWEEHGTRVAETLFRWDQGRAEGERLPFTFRLGSLELPPLGNGSHWVSIALTVLLFVPRIVLVGLFLLLAGTWWIFVRVFAAVTWPAAKLVESVGQSYPSVLTTAVRLRWVVVPLMFVLLFGALVVIPGLGTQLVPDLAQGEFAFRIRLPEGTPLETTTQVVERIEAPLVEDARFSRVFSVVGSLPSAASGQQQQGENLAQINFVLVEGSNADRERASVDRVRDVLRLFPSADTELVHPSVLTLKPPIAVHLFTENLETLEDAAASVLAALRELPHLRDVASTAEPGSPEIRVELDREKAATLGVQAESLSSSMRRQIQGEVVGKFREEEERLDIRLRAAEPFRTRASRVEELRVRLADGTAVPVSALARVEVDRGPAAIHRVGGSRVAELTARAPATDLGSALGAVRELLDGIALPSDAVAELAGQDEELKTSFDSLRLALGLAIFLVYVVMAAQFESLLHPFVILLAVPMGVIGVVATLLLTSTPISVLVLIGVVMLSGIVVNNAIVLIDAINRRRRAEGHELDDAILEAGKERLRPILMTTTTTVLALLPMALGLGAGDELRSPLAITVIGGLLAATALTLIVTPCLYRILSGGMRKRRTTSARARSGVAAGPAVPEAK
jgi:HAE1 family hydrophobic/amphiphilic exporter-1